MNIDKNKKLLIILFMLLAFGIALMGLYNKYSPHRSENISLLFISFFIVLLLYGCFLVIQHGQLEIKQEVQKNIDMGMNVDEAYKKVIKKRQKRETNIIYFVWLIPIWIGSSRKTGPALIDQSQTILYIWIVWLFLGWLPPYAYFKYKKHKNKIITY